MTDPLEAPPPPPPGLGGPVAQSQAQGAWQGAPSQTHAAGSQAVYADSYASLYGSHYPAPPGQASASAAPPAAPSAPLPPPPGQAGTYDYSHYYAGYPPPQQQYHHLTGPPPPGQQHHYDHNAYYQHHQYAATGTPPPQPLPPHYHLQAGATFGAATRPLPPPPGLGPPTQAGGAVSYRAVPPPTALHPGGGRGRGRGGGGVGMKPPPGHLRSQYQHQQHQYQRTATTSNAGGNGAAASSIVGAAQAAAAAISAGKAPSVAAAPQRPAYISVATGSQMTAAPGSRVPALNPQNWPPDVKSYVERAFKAAPFRQRAKLQDVLRTIINDAQEKGELLTLGWDTLPLPDLTQSAQDAAALILELCAIHKSNSTGTGSITTGSWRQQQPQQPQQLPVQPLRRTMITLGGGGGGGGAIATATNSTTHLNAHRSNMFGMVSGNPSFDSYALNNNNNKISRNNRPDKYPKRSRKRDRWGNIHNIDNNWSTDSDNSDDIDTGGDDGTSQGGPYSADEEARRRRRAGRFKDGTADGVNSNLNHISKKKSSSSAKRRAKLSALLDDAGGAGEDIDWNQFAIKGTCQKLEKSYFRLTSAPDPSTVRPESVLRRALDRLVHLIATGEVNYFYAQDQFKGLRQDCVVQAIQGPIALAVYEAHARAALEYGDVAEYNQCQGQMAALLAEGVKSEGHCEAEFLACRILYQTVHARHGEHLQLLHTLRKVGPREAGIPEVAHALKVRSAVASEDYALFFKLYSIAPKLGRALMDLAVPRLRFGCLNSFVKAYKPSLPVAFLARMLGFVTENSTGNSAEKEEGKKKKEKSIEQQQPLPGCVSVVFEGAHAAKETETGKQQCLEWLVECGAVVTGVGGEAMIDCKASTGQLTMPPEKQKVAHGDANLDIGDFLKSFE